MSDVVLEGVEKKILDCVVLIAVAERHMSHCNSSSSEYLDTEERKKVVEARLSKLQCLQKRLLDKEKKGGKE